MSYYKGGSTTKTQFRLHKKGITKLSIYTAIVVLLLLLPTIGLPIFWMHIFIGVFIYFILTGSLRLVGISGQGSLGHAGFMCIGAYTSALLAKDFHWTPWLTIILAALVALGMALLVGRLICRLRGIYFVMMSLFIGMAILSIVQIFQRWTGGQSGLGQIPPLFHAGKEPYYYFFLILAVVCLAIMYRIEFSRIGITWKAIAQSYSVASSIGINEYGQRVFCLAIGAFFAGLAGGAFPHYYLSLSMDSAGFSVSMNMFIYMMVGGINSINGPIVGVAILTIIPAYFRELKDNVPFINAGILLVMLFLAPQGLVSLPGKIKSWIDKLSKARVAEKEVVDRAP